MSLWTLYTDKIAKCNFLDPLLFIGVEEIRRLSVTDSNPSIKSTIRTLQHLTYTVGTKKNNCAITIKGHEEKAGITMRSEVSLPCLASFGIKQTDQHCKHSLALCTLLASF